MLAVRAGGREGGPPLLTSAVAAVIDLSGRQLGGSLCRSVDRVAAADQGPGEPGPPREGAAARRAAQGARIHAAAAAAAEGTAAARGGRRGGAGQQQGWRHVGVSEPAPGFLHRLPALLVPLAPPPRLPAVFRGPPPQPQLLLLHLPGIIIAAAAAGRLLQAPTRRSGSQRTLPAACPHSYAVSRRYLLLLLLLLLSWSIACLLVQSQGQVARHRHGAGRRRRRRRRDSMWWGAAQPRYTPLHHGRKPMPPPRPAATRTGAAAAGAVAGARAGPQRVAVARPR